MLKSDHERVRNLITETVTLLCKNGLTFNSNLNIEGLLAITIDDEEIFVVPIKEAMHSEKEVPETADLTANLACNSPSDSPRRKRRRHSQSLTIPVSGDQMAFRNENAPILKQEYEDDKSLEADLVIVKEENFTSGVENHHPLQMLHAINSGNNGTNQVRSSNPHDYNSTQSQDRVQEFNNSQMPPVSMLLSQTNMFPSASQPPPPEFECSTCHKHFSTQSNLNDHQLRHQGYYRYRCSECGRGFSATVNLKRHMESVHGMSGMYECRVCGQKVDQWNEFCRHHGNNCKDNRQSLSGQEEGLSKENVETSQNPSPQK